MTRIKFRDLFQKLDDGEEIDGKLYYDGHILEVKEYPDGGWRIIVDGDNDLCMNMSSESLNSEVEIIKDAGIGFARTWTAGDLPCLASDTMMESSCATGVAGTSTYVAPLYTKETR